MAPATSNKNTAYSSGVADNSEDARGADDRRVFREINQLGDSIEDMRIALGDLILELDPVIFPEEMVDVASLIDRERGRMCVLAERINGLNNRVKEAVEIVRFTINRLEI
jgi:methyl-accepting chemotaxis protein